jgi:hypothetical protein
MTGLATTIANRQTGWIKPSRTPVSSGRRMKRSRAETIFCVSFDQAKGRLDAAVTGVTDDTINETLVPITRQCSAIWSCRQPRRQHRDGVGAAHET